MSGVFSLIVHDLGVQPKDLSFWDMLRAKVDPNKIPVNGMEAYLTATPLGRFEELPRTFAGDPGRIGFYRVAMEAARRFGRAVHIFSGLPVSRREFFYCDQMDAELVTLLGKTGFRIEELPAAIEKLRMLEAIANPRKADGLGMVDVGKNFCLPNKRFSAGCRAWAAARDAVDAASSAVTAGGFVHTMVEIDRYLANEVKTMSNSTIVPVAHLASAVQKKPSLDSSANEKTFLITTAIKIAEDNYRTKNRDDLLAMICGSIYTEANRKDKGSGKFFAAKCNRAEDQKILDAIRAFGEGFLDLIWFGDWKGRPVNASQRKAVIDGYLWAFTTTPSATPKKKEVEFADNKGNTSEELT